MTNNVEMITAMGHEVRFLHPEQTPVDWRDLQTATCNICRYNGHIRWELVRHLYLCLKLAETAHPNDKYLQALVSAHDLHEAYVTDVVSGLKQHLPRYGAIEESWMAYVHNSIGLPYKDISVPAARTIKVIDLRALTCETYGLTHPGYDIIQKRFGGPPTKAELRAFNIACARPLDYCWTRVYDAITTYVGK